MSGGAHIEPANLSCEFGESKAAGRFFVPSSLDVEPVAGLKSGSNFTIGGRSSDWLVFTASNDTPTAGRSPIGGLGEPLLSFSSVVQSLDATPLAIVATAVAPIGATEALAATAEVWPVEGFKVALVSLDATTGSTEIATGALASEELLPAGISGEEVREPPPPDPEPALRVSLGSRS